MIGLVTDLRHALRRLNARPLASALAIGMLALAIGVTTAMFTVVDALLLRPAPFPDSARLAHVTMRTGRTIRGNVAPDVLRAWRESSVFAAVEGAHPTTSVIEAGTGVVAREAAFATPGLFTMLGARPVHGRLFTENEGRIGTDDRLILSERLWRGVLGADPSVLGTRVRIDGQPLVVVGILPDTFRFPSWDTELWRPIDYAALPPPLAASRPRAYVRFAVSVPQDAALGGDDACARRRSGVEGYARDEPTAGRSSSGQLPGTGDAVSRRQRRARIPHTLRERQQPSAGAAWRSRA
jgi:putative ABC transport system permease protein